MSRLSSLKKKNKREILREFDKEKYSDLITKIDHRMSLEDIDKIFTGKKILYKKNIEKIINNYSYKVNSIVELGCGYGSIGLYLKKNIKKKNFLFLDISPNGLKCLKKIDKKSNVGMIDIYNCKVNKKLIPKNALFYTVSSMHYKSKITSKIIRFLMKFRPKIIVHIEPFYELAKPNMKRYITKNNYNQNLLQLLKQLEKKKELQILKQTKRIFKSDTGLEYYGLIYKPML